MQEEAKEENVIVTNPDALNGQTKCPKCGATDISLNINTGKLRCNFCRYEFDAAKVDAFNKDISNLKGQNVTTGSQDIKNNTDFDIMTLKCSSCGAEVVIETTKNVQARCHWCRNVLSINQQIPNGANPDYVLPFKISKDEAQTLINNFVNKRKFYANPTFKKEFTTENILGVYFPYMLVNLNAHSLLDGEGEHLVRCYTVGNDEDRRTYYDADLYHIGRDFDLQIKGLTIESNSQRLNNMADDKTNNIINSIMPFDIENCVRWDANYLRGFTSEKRDINIEQLRPIVELQAKDIARFKANDTLKFYDRGVKWQKEELAIKGEEWGSAYLPVWLYSYMQHKGGKKILHYVAVNARTKEVMGSVPIHMPKLLGISAIIELISFYGMVEIDYEYDFLLLTLGVIYFIVIYLRYRNSNARHHHERETDTSVENMKRQDVFVNHRRRLSNPSMIGANNHNVNGSTTSHDFLATITDKSETIDLIDKTINKN